MTQTRNRSLEPLRIAVIGQGPWGRNIANALRDLSAGRVAGTRQVTKHHVLTFGREADIASIAKEMDAVALAVPPGVQATLAPYFLGEGVPLFLEKPATFSSAQMRNTLALLRVVPAPYVLVDHVHLHHGAWDSLKAEVARAGGANEVVQMDIVVGGPGPVRAWPVRETSLWDYGPHAVAYALDLFDRPPSDLEAFRASWDLPTARGSYFADMRFAGARVFTRFGNDFTEKTCRVTVHMRGGGFLKLDEYGKKVLTNTVGQKIDFFEKPTPLTSALWKWTDAIQKKTPSTLVRYGLGSALENVMTLERIEDAVAKGGARNEITDDLLKKGWMAS